MPNIQSQEISPDGTITVVATGGATFSITKETILGDFAGRLGDRNTRRLLTRARIKTEFAAVIGPELVDVAYMDLDFDESTGRPTLLQFRTPGGE